MPALRSGDYVAVTFLTLAIQQFREIRKVERESLVALEHTEFVPRGQAYIDGIAKTFKVRNYFSLIASLSVTIIPLFFKIPLKISLSLGVVVGFVIVIMLKHFSRGGMVRDICEIKQGKLSFKNNELYVEDIYLMNLGADRARQLVLNEGIGLILTPKEQHLGISLANFGQRQAILHEAARSQGLKRYAVTRRDFKQGRIGMMIVPIKQDLNGLMEVVERTPLLESTKKSQRLLKESKPVGGSA